MRKSWRIYAMILLFGVWPHLGCHQLPAYKSVPDLRPIQQKPSDAPKMPALTAADLTPPSPPEAAHAATYSQPRPPPALPPPAP